jgi:ADP-dependent phosphofructokinase/glucokinase
MKDIWRMRYRQNTRPKGKAKVLTGFNANIDSYYHLKKIEMELEDVEPEKVEEVERTSDLKKALKYFKENQVNMEVEKSFNAEMPEPERQRLGGQAGIFSNFLSRMDFQAVFYTPILSERLAELVEEDVETPVLEEHLMLKRPVDAVNADQTKENIIIESSSGKTCRLIISDKLEGFGPFFRSGIEENFGALKEEVDRAVFSGFHDATGNFEAKLDKSEVQMEKLDVPKHLEYVNTSREKSEKILEDLLPRFESLGMDEQEALEIAEVTGLETGEELSLGEAFQLGKKLISGKESLERCHIHTYRYHVVIADRDYEVRSESIRKAMVFGENCALLTGDTGELPDESAMADYSLDNKHVHRLDPLEHFAHHFDLEDFLEEGIAELDGFRVIAIPTLVHEDPKRVTGMGDIISCGTFAAESR